MGKSLLGKVSPLLVQELITGGYRTSGCAWENASSEEVGNIVYKEIIGAYFVDMIGHMH